MKRFLAWARTEPARVRIYGVLIPIAGLLVARGIIAGSDIPFYEAVLVALLGIPATETVRAKVVPLSKLGPNPGEVDITTARVGPSSGVSDAGDGTP